MIYFDNAATTFPKPPAVKEAVISSMERYGANPGRSGHKMSMDTAIKVYETREAAAVFFGAQEVEDVAFTSNCTHALNFALKGLLKYGDHVIISDLEHNSVTRPIHKMKDSGVTYSVAVTSEDDDETVEAFRRLITPRTRLIACTHGSNVWGIKLPIKKIGALAESYGVLFLVDAAQTAGVIPIDMRTCGIDFLCTAGHKSLYGPSGTGLLITPLGSVLGTVFEGGTGSTSSDPNQPETMPDRLESGTVNTSGIIGLGAGIKYINDTGIRNIYEAEMAVGREIYEGLRRVNKIKLYTTGFVSGRNLPVISFNISGMMSEEVVSQLADMGFALRGGLHCAPLAHQKMGTLETGAVRVSIGCFNTKEQAAGLLEAIRRVARG